MTLKSLQRGRKLAKAGEDTGCRENVGPVQGAFPGFVPGTLQDVYPLMVGLWRSSLDPSALVRQIGKGNSLGENALTAHDIPSGFWVPLLQQGNIPFPTLWTKFTTETEHRWTWVWRGLQSNWALLPGFKPGRLLSFESLSILEERSHSRLLLSHNPELDGSSLNEATGSWSPNSQTSPGDAVHIIWMSLGWRGFCDLEPVIHSLSTLVNPSKKWGQPCFLFISQR